MSQRYARLMLDFMFRKAFGTAANKPLLLSLLDSFLGHRIASPITDVEFLQSITVGDTPASRGTVFDLLCKDQQGNRFLIEVQLKEQEYFTDRALFYRSRTQSEMAVKGADWNYRMPALHVLAFLNFRLDDSPSHIREILLMNAATLEVFTDRESFTYVEVPKFHNDIRKCTTMQERWIWMFGNLHKLKEMPPELGQTLFETLFRMAEIANFKGEELEQYRQSMEFYDDTQKCIDWATKKASEKGMAEGLAKGLTKGLAQAKLEDIRRMQAKGFDWKLIEELTGVSEGQLPDLLSQADCN